MDDKMKMAIEAVRRDALASKTAPADEAAPTPGDAMDPAAGSTVSSSEPSQGGGVMDILGSVANAGMETAGRLINGEADPEFASAVTGAETQLDNTQTDPNAEPSLHEKAVATMAAIPTGAVKAGYEAVDGAKSLVGIDPGPKSEERSKVETLDEALRSKTMAAGLSSTLSSFTVGLIGAGKILGPLKAAMPAGKAATAAYEVGKGVLAGYFSIGPHEERLSNLIQSFPSLENPVSEYLAADPNDSQIEGRMKNALEGAGMDIAAAVLFAGGLKVLKALRSGDKEAAKVAASELDTVSQEVMQGPPTKPRVRVQAGSQVVVPEVPAAVEKPRVRVKAGSTAVEEIPSVQQSPPMAQSSDNTGANGTMGLGPTNGGRGQEVGGPAPSINDASPNATDTGVFRPTKDQGTWQGDEPPVLQGKDDVSSPPQVPPTEASPQGVNLADESAAVIIDRTRADLEMVDAAGGLSKAIEQGYKLDNLPWPRMNTGQDVDVLVENAVKEAKPTLDAMKGGDVLYDSAVAASMKDIAKTYRIDPQILLGEISQAGESAIESVKRMEAGHLIFRKMSLDVTSAVKKFNAGQFGEFGSEEVARAEIKRRLGLMLEVYGNTRSIIANAGRVVRRQRGEFDNLGPLLQEMNKVDDKYLFKKIEEMDGDPELIREAMSPGFWRRVNEEASFSMRNGLLWLYPSHVFNVTGNVLITALRPLETAVGSLATGAKGSYLRGRAMKEYLYMATSATDGFKAALKTFLEADSRLAPHGTELINANEMSTNLRDLRDLQLIPVKDFSDMWANTQAVLTYGYRNITGLPSRVMGMQDEFFKTVRYRGLVQAEAAMKGAAEGKTGDDLLAHIKEALSKAFDEEGRGIDKAALLEAQRSTLSQELLSGTLGASIRNFRGQHPWVGLILPYVKTPINALRYAHKYTPALNLLQQEYRQALGGALGVEEQARAYGQMAMGTMLMSYATLLAAQGKITGGGPTDKKLRKILTDDGWRPYSVPVKNEDGSTTYVPYNRMDPVSMPFALAADCYDGYLSGGDMKSVMWACALASAKNFSERGFTLNIQSAIQAFNDAEGKGPQFLGRLAGQTIPTSSALRGYVNQDPYMREARSIVDFALKDMPGYSNTLPPHRDPFGEPVLRRIGVSSKGTSEVVNRENDRMILESGFGVAPPNPVRDDVDLRDVTLEDGSNAYDRYLELMGDPGNGQPKLKDQLAKLIESDEYQSLIDGDASEEGSRLNALSKVITPYRDAAYKRVLSESPSLQKAVLSKKYEFKAKAADKANGDTSVSERLMEALSNLR